MSIYDFEVKSIRGEAVSMADYQGKVMLIVNTASECGFTYQYQGLEKLHNEFKERGVVVMGFPCNQFKGQEPGDEAQISQFCELNFGVTFPLFAKIDVNGENASPLYTFLKEAKPGLLGSKRVKWNFTKFLVDQKGNVVGRYAPTTKPKEIWSDIEALLA